MTALFIAAGVLAIVVLLFLCPVAVSVQFESEWSVRIRYLFLSFPVYPPRKSKEEKKEPEKSAKRKKRKKQASKEPKEEKKETFQAILKQKGAGGVLHLLTQLAHAAAGPLKTLFSHIRFHSFWLDLAVAGEDAAETALQYGRICAAAYPAIGVLVSTARCKSYHVCILPDFGGGETRARFSARLRVRLWFLIRAAVTLFFRAIATYKKEIQ